MGDALVLDDRGMKLTALYFRNEETRREDNVYLDNDRTIRHSRCTSDELTTCPFPRGDYSSVKIRTF